MAAANPTISTFAGVAPPWSLANLDANFVAVANIINSINTYEQYAADTGAANVYVIAFAAGTAITLSAGLGVTFKATNANTGASTLNAGGTGAKTIVNPDGSALIAGQIAAGGVVKCVYDGTNYQLQSTTKQTGTFTATLTGCTATITGTAKYSINGNVVTLDLPVLIGTSNTTACTITGLPAALQPASGKTMAALTEDNSASGIVSLLSLNGAIITLFNGNPPTATFTSANTKGLAAQAQFTYTLA